MVLAIVTKGSVGSSDRAFSILADRHAVPCQLASAIFPFIAHWSRSHHICCNALITLDIVTVFPLLTSFSDPYVCFVYVSARAVVTVQKRK